jgi:hypothetical protein|tara:strand:- start:8285 stop:10906 length:2622 start_codon:yes stop_codon:yes gene_type:complete
MSNGINYSADDYSVEGAAGPGGILSTYKQEIADYQKDLDTMIVAAKQQILSKQKRDKAAAKAIYGITLGEMYDGDREAVQVYRDYIYNNYESGAYTNDPVQYQKDVAQLNNLITNFTTFYTQTYGTNTANGQGTTYSDMVYNQTLGIENPFESQGMMYDPNIDPFDQAQKTLAFRQMGGYAPNSVRVNEDGILVARSLTYKDDGRHVVGPEMPITEMPDRQAGVQTFMPALVEDTTTIFDYIKKNKQDILIMQGRANFTVEESTAEYFDNEVANNTKFQRDMIKANSSAGITNEDIKAYQEGSLEGNKAILIEEALAKSKQEFIKSAIFGTLEEPGDPDANKRSDGENMFSGPVQDFSLTGPAVGQNLDVEGRDVIPGAVDYSGEDPIGTREGESVDYMGLSRGIPPIEMTGGQYGDYKIIRIAAGDNGDRYAIIEEDEFIMKNAAGQYVKVDRGTPGATKGQPRRITINLTNPEANESEDINQRINDIKRALIEYDGAYNQLVVESQARLTERSKVLAQERAEDERRRQEQERRDAEYEAANDPNINVEAVNEEAIKDVEEMQAEERERQEIEDQKAADARYALFYGQLSEGDKEFYRAPNEPAPDFNIWGQKTGGGRVRYGDQGAFATGHSKVMKDYAKDELEKKVIEQSQSAFGNFYVLGDGSVIDLGEDGMEKVITTILNSPELEGALKELGFTVEATGPSGLQKAAEVIGQGAYPKKKEQINKAIDKVLESGIVEKILLRPTPVEEAPIAEGAADDADETTFYKRIESALEAASKLDENALDINVANDLAATINYLESHPNPEQEKEKIIKALDDGKIFYVANNNLIIYDPEEKVELTKERDRILAKSEKVGYENLTEEEKQVLSKYI